MTAFELYYEGGTRDRFWIAPPHLPLGEARRQRVTPYYKTRAGAMRALASRQHAERVVVLDPPPADQVRIDMRVDMRGGE